VGQLPLLPAEGPATLVPGAVWLPGLLGPGAQRALAAACLARLDGPHGGYVPRVRGGGRMRVRMVCLGRHWNAATYRYEAMRADHDGAPVEPVPEELAAMAAGAARAAGFTCTPDICLISHYGADGRMGLHQDRDESPTAIAAGLPVVSLSIGDTARFLFGGRGRRDRVQAVPLASGDAFVFGGDARLCYHGVARIHPGTAPPGLGFAGRLNLTFRCY
jgi:alkylated DNA repair protein (DNA oxidative demethylase)